MQYHHQIYQHQKFTIMKTKKETVNIYELTPQEHVALINSRKHSKTWEAAMKSQGCFIITDPNLML